MEELKCSSYNAIYIYCAEIENLSLTNFLLQMKINYCDRILNFPPHGKCGFNIVFLLSYFILF